MTEKNVIELVQSNSQKSLISFKENGNEISFDCGIKYSDLVIFSKDKKIFVVRHGWSSSFEFVGAIFDFKGNNLFNVNFPVFDSSCAHVNCSFSWLSAKDATVKMVFGTDSITVGDFWIDFHLDSMSYGDSGRSR